LADGTSSMRISDSDFQSDGNMKASFRQIVGPTPEGYSAPQRVFSRPKDMSNKEEPAVDVRRIEELRALQPEDPEGLMYELVELFLKSSPDSLQRARRGIEESNPMALARAAHLLKGCCAQFGAHRMCTLCSTLEEAGLSSSTANTVALLNETEREFKRVCAALAPYF
jgi:HPt (histidine-containing phosphotransfer) domain-containing protein